MSTTIPRINFPELFLGFVAPIGAELKGVISDFKVKFENFGYEVVDIKVTDIFSILHEYVYPVLTLDKKPGYNRYTTYIKYGNQLRGEFDDDAVLAVTTISQIIRKRLKLKEKGKIDRTVFLIHQFKRKEEVDLFRSVYGRLFFQISVYSRRGARVDYLSRQFASSRDISGPQKYRHLAESIIGDDENEVEQKHGQRVAKIFHDADLILSLDASIGIQSQIDRFCELIFGSNSISPTRQEYGMFSAKSAALRTLDLSRQVGAAIFGQSGEIVSLGSNEVPKATGGTYWSGGKFDDREYKHQVDSNDQRKKEIISEIIRIVNPDADIDLFLEDNRIKDSQFMDALEYGRIVHAEMSAISDAARLGHSIKDGTLYCTTFPCHMCAKHIIASGIKKVVFLEPYPKSLAFDLHADALQIEGGDRGQYQEYPAVQFEHFFGVSPRRYREIFERFKRKGEDGKFQSYMDGMRRPIIDIKFPFYYELESQVLGEAAQGLAKLVDKLE